MISATEFVKQSLELHLFFARIMKEHAFFLQVAFTTKDFEYIQQADAFRMEFDNLLEEVISLSNGVVSPNVLESGEVVTQYTLNAEMESAYYTGVKIKTSLTYEESNLVSEGSMGANPMLEQMVCILNQKIMELLTSFIQFKNRVLSNVLSCRMYTANYPLLIDHILREAILYFHTIQRLQNRRKINEQREIYEQEFFWNRIMAEHSKFIRGFLDPTENDLINTANNFGNRFDQLTMEAKQAMEKSLPSAKVTNDSLKATKEIRDFKAQGTQGLIECKIKSLIFPLLGDHVLREASRYIRLLEMFEKR